MQLMVKMTCESACAMLLSHWLVWEPTHVTKVSAKTQRGRGEPRPYKTTEFGKEANVQEIQGFERERNTGAGHFF
jgi:hypothetical protein